MIDILEATVTKTTAVVEVTPPEFGPPTIGWAKYTLTICPTNPAGTCFTQDCTPASISYPTKNSCTLTNLTPNTDYTVEVGVGAGRGAGSAAAVPAGPARRAQRTIHTGQPYTVGQQHFR